MTERLSKVLQILSLKDLFFSARFWARIFITISQYFVVFKSLVKKLIQFFVILKLKKMHYADANTFQCLICDTRPICIECKAFSETPCLQTLMIDT